MIYCVEDERNIRELLIYTLETTGFQARGFETGKEFRAALEEELPELVLLDIMLPGEDGYTILEKLKNNPETRNIPVIMVTAKEAEYDKVRGLEGGADDYITKPFSMDELVARISAHLRREERKHEASNLRFDDELIINYDSHTVFYKEKQLEFSNKEFEIIRLLSQNAGMVFDRETIYEKLVL